MIKLFRRAIVAGYKDAVICTRCGGQLDQLTPARLKWYTREYKYCPFCGHKFRYFKNKEEETYV